VDKVVESTKILLFQRRHIDDSILERQEDITANLIIELGITVQHNPNNNEQENPVLQQTLPPNKPELQQRQQAKIHEIADRAQLLSLEIPLNDQGDSEVPQQVNRQVRHHQT
jgi:hypothetical protein